MLEEFRAIRSELMSKLPSENESGLVNLSVCGEEASELAKVCIEGVRLLANDESLRKGGHYICNNLNEEVADVINCICNLYDAGLIDRDSVMAHFKAKCTRYEVAINGGRR